MLTRFKFRTVTVVEVLTIVRGNVKGYIFRR